MADEGAVLAEAEVVVEIAATQVEDLAEEHLLQLTFIETTWIQTSWIQIFWIQTCRIQTCCCHAAGLGWRGVCAGRRRLLGESGQLQGSNCGRHHEPSAEKAQ